LKYVHLSDAQLRAEIEKCLYCADKPCLEACPSHCSPADFIMAARRGKETDFGRAAELILSKNPMGHTCGVVCPDTLCMDACSRKHFDAPVNIPAIQAALIERARGSGRIRTPEPAALNGKRVAVIGAGPAGLAATASLARKGYSVDLFDSQKNPGGACLMIPEDRLPRTALKGDTDYILKLGAIQTQLGKPAPDPAKLLKDGFDAVLVAIGQPESVGLGIPGESLAVSSIEYLRNPSKYRGRKQVAIFGGGAVATDCAIIARKNGAASVELFVRRTIGEMPLTAHERQQLLDLQVDITTRTRVLGIRPAGKKFTLRTAKLEPIPGKADARALREIPGTTVKRPGFDLVVLAIGSTWSGADKNKKIIPLVFYAGDCVEGASTVVEAAASGKNAANEIDLALSKATTAEKAELKKSKTPGSKSRIKSRSSLAGIAGNPVDPKADFFGIPIRSPFLLSAAPSTDGFDQMVKAYEAGWAGAVMKTAFDGLHVHIPGGYMFTFGEGEKTHGNCDNVSDHPLDRVCSELKQIRKLYPDRLTMASTGGPVTGNDASDARVWQANTLKLEQAGAMGVEYSLSCPQGGDGTEGDIVSQNAAITAKVIDWVMQVSDPAVPKLFKLTAAVTSIKPILSAIREVFARYPGKKAGVTLANSFPVLGFREAPGRKWQEGVVVGMSGEGVVPISYLTLANVANSGVTVSGNGGVMNYEAAANFLALGARTVQMCTIATHYGLGIINELESGLSHLLKAKGLSSVKELIGIALPNPVTGFMDLPATKQVSDVQPDICESCGNCTRCPYLAISLDKNKHPVTDAALCVGCTICVKSCFAGALYMRDRDQKGR